MVRNILVIAVLVMMSIGTAVNATNSVVKRYAEVCVKMQKAIDLHDKDLLTQVMNDMDEMELDLMDKTAVTADNPDSECEAKIVFMPEFADQLLLNDFDIASLDDVSILRAPVSDSVVNAICRGVNANSTVSYTLEGEGDVSLFMLPVGGALNIKVYGNCDKEVELSKDSEGLCWSSWTMDSPGSFRIELTNNSGQPISFVLGIN